MLFRSATVIASKDEEVAVAFQTVVNGPYFRVYTSSDMRGVELGGILKNIMAIAAGAVDGLKLGQNAKSTLMTRSIQEIIRFGIANGADRETFFGLSGFGDLITTCSSSKSRNWQVGFGLSQNKNLEDILIQLGQVAEGVKTTKIIYPLSQEQGIEMPITTEVYRVIFEGKDPKEALKHLMSRKVKSET